jgi:hypothetical protein
MEGHATLDTGAIHHPRGSPPGSQVVNVLNGPSTVGTVVEGGVSRMFGPGDVVIIPPNTPHWSSEITSPQIVYLVVRLDPAWSKDPIHMKSNDDGCGGPSCDAAPPLTLPGRNATLRHRGITSLTLA